MEDLKTEDWVSNVPVRARFSRGEDEEDEEGRRSTGGS